jgi:hypothetical protein
VLNKASRVVPYLAVALQSLVGCARTHQWPVSHLVPPSSIIVQGQGPAWSKLVASDDQGRVLVIRSRGQWEIPGTEMPAEQSDTEEGCRRFLDEFAAELGLQVEEPRLAGVFLQRFETRIEKATEFRWYAARAMVVAPPADIETKWINVSDAVEQIPYPMGRRILRQLTDRPDVVWTAEYAVNYSVDPPGGILRVIRSFSPLRD